MHRLTMLGILFALAAAFVAPAAPASAGQRCGPHRHWIAGHWMGYGRHRHFVPGHCT